MSTRLKYCRHINRAGDLLHNQSEPIVLKDGGCKTVRG